MTQMGNPFPVLNLPSAGENAEVDRLCSSMSGVAVPDTLNFYDESASVAAGDRPGEATARLNWLRHYLTARWAAPVVLVGEAPGHLGARRSGVPFTSVRQLTAAGPAEQSATMVHHVLADLDAEERVVLWNACFLHPHHRGRPASNRKPRSVELRACADVLTTVCAGRRIIAIGRVAAAVTGGHYVRHPANGGRPEFAAGLQLALRQ